MTGDKWRETSGFLSPGVTGRPVPVTDLARSHALTDLAADATQRAASARAAMARCQPGEDHDYLTARAAELERIAMRLRDAPGFRLPGAAP